LRCLGFAGAGPNFCFGPAWLRGVERVGFAI
jgi:hypothetical protein